MYQLNIPKDSPQEEITVSYRELDLLPKDFRPRCHNLKYYSARRRHSLKHYASPNVNESSLNSQILDESDKSDLKGATFCEPFSHSPFQRDTIVESKIDELYQRREHLLSQGKTEFIINAGSVNTEDLIYHKPCNNEIAALLHVAERRTIAFCEEYIIPQYMMTELVAAVRYTLRNRLEYTYTTFINIISKEITKKNKGRKWPKNDLGKLQLPCEINDFLISQLGIDIAHLNCEALKIASRDNENLKKIIKKIIAMIIVVSGSDKFTSDQSKAKDDAEKLTKELFEKLLLGMKLSISFGYKCKSEPKCPVCELKFKSISIDLIYED